MPKNLELFSKSAGLCIIDIQEKLAAAMPDKVIKGTLRNCLNLIEAARIFEIPIAVSEQLPDALGRSLPVVAESVLRLPREQVFFFDKTRFSCVGDSSFDAWIKRTGRSQWLLSGMETHISIYHTARAMAAAGYAVQVPRDAVVSRTMANWEMGLQLIKRCDCVVTSTETAIFDLLKQAGTEDFAVLSKIIK